MAEFKFTPYSQGEPKATTTSGGGSFKFTPYKPKESLDQFFPAREMVRNASTKTQTTPKPTVGQIAKELAVPSRGFTDVETQEAKPSAKDIGIGAAKYAGEFTTGVSQLSSAALRRIPGLRWLASSPEEYKKYEEAFAPTTAGQAKTMRGLDIATLGVGGTIKSTKNIGKLETIRDTIIKRLESEVPSSVPGRTVKADILGDTDAAQAAKRLLEELKKSPEPNVDILNRGLEALRTTGRQVDDIAKELRTIGDEATVVQRAGAQDIQPSRVASGTEKGARFAEGAKTMFKGADIQAAKITPRSTAALSEQAQNIVQTAEKVDLESIIARNDDLGTATAAEYLNKLARDYSSATDLARKTELATEAARVANMKAERLAEAGREIQAASLLSRLTPEGQLRYVASEINKYNKKNPKKTIPNLTTQQSKEILDEMDAIRKTVDPSERALRFFRLQRRVQEMIPSSTLKKLSTLWKAGLLTGIKTSGLNIFSNTSHFVTENLSQVPAAIADSMLSVLTGKRTLSTTTRGLLPGLKEGKVKGLRYFFSGFDERNIAGKLDYTRVNFGKGKVAKAFQKYTDTVFQTIGAQDQPFYYATLSRSYMDQALAMARNEGLRGKARVKRAYEIVENPTEEMMEYAVRDATTAVFTNETALGRAAQHLQKTAGGAGQFVVPFARTPSAVAVQIFNYTPAGAVAEAVKQIKKGKFDQRILSQAIGRSTVGTIPIYIGWELAGKGMVSLDYPQGDSRKIELNKAEGVPYNSVKIGDEWRNPIVLGPVGNLILFGAHMRNAFETEGSPSKAVGKAALGLYDSFKEQTFLTGISSFVAAIDDLTGRGESAVNGFIASFIPTIVSDVARATDTAERNVDGLKARVKSRIPGARQTLEPKVDILGREQAISGRGGEFLPDFVESMADPTRPSQDVSTDVTKEMRRLQTMGDTKTGETFNVVPTRSGLYGYDVLTDKQETELQKYAGGIINDKLSNLFLLPAYQNLPDEKKAEAIQEVTKKAKDAARARMVLEILQAIPIEQRKSALIRMYEDKLITRDVERMLEGSF